MSLTVQVVLTGLSAGGVYGLIAIGHSVVYRLTGIVHFALGDLIGLGAFATLLVAAGTAPLTVESVSGLRIVAAVAVGLLVCVLAGVAGYLLVVQPYLGSKSPIGWIAATLALGFAIRAALDAAFTRSAYAFPDPVPFQRIGDDGVVSVLGARVHVRAFAVIAVAVALAALASWVLQQTRFGRGLRAVAADPEAAQMVGVNVELLRAIAFGLTGGIAAIATIVAAPGSPFETGSGALLGLKGLVAAVVVRFGGLWNAFAAGLVLGVCEAAVGAGALGHLGLGTDYREVLPILVALAILAARPIAAEEAVE